MAILFFTNSNSHKRFNTKICGCSKIYPSHSFLCGFRVTKVPFVHVSDRVARPRHAPASVSEPRTTRRQRSSDVELMIGWRGCLNCHEVVLSERWRSIRSEVSVDVSASVVKEQCRILSYGSSQPSFNTRLRLWSSSFSLLSQSSVCLSFF